MIFGGLHIEMAELFMNSLAEELTILTLIGSSTETDFVWYGEAPLELIPYFFADDNINYARCLLIHLRDMISMKHQHPQVAREFHKGNFVVHKSCIENFQQCPPIKPMNKKIMSSKTIEEHLD